MAIRQLVPFLGISIVVLLLLLVTSCTKPIESINYTNEEGAQESVSSAPDMQDNSQNSVQTDFFELELPEAWEGKVDIDYGSDYTTIIDSDKQIELCTFIYRDAGSELRSRGDIGYSWVGEKQGTKGKVIEVWAYRWPFLLWDSEVSENHEYDSMTEEQKAEIIEMTTGGSLSLNELFNATDYEKAAELFFAEDEYLRKAIVDPMVVY